MGCKQFREHRYYKKLFQKDIPESLFKTKNQSGKIVLFKSDFYVNQNETIKKPSKFYFVKNSLKIVK